MNYSNVTYNISITVGQDEKTGEAITENAKLVNVYAVPIIPETGDNSHAEPFAILMGVSTVCLLESLC